MITYKDGDLLKSRCDIICHQTNCMGVMGAGIAKQIRKIHPTVYKSYKYFCNEYGCEFVFGHTLLCPIGNNKYIANMFAQYDFLPQGVKHTDYVKFKECCRGLKASALKLYQNRNPKIGFPYRIGCGLGGGDWTTIECIIHDAFDDSWDIEIWKLKDKH